MKIGVIGAGDVGQTLAEGFAELGDDVMIGTRDPKKLDALLKKLKGKKVTVGSFDQAAKFGELLVFAVKGDAAEEVIAKAGPKNFAGKTVIDTTNPIAASNDGIKLFVGFNDSLAERIQKKLPGAYVVKTLNITPAARMVNPKFKEGEPDMLLCGNNETAKKQVERILRDFGWRNVTDIGNLEQARIMEPMVAVWGAYGMKHNIWSHGFKILKE
jgi:8-hydroxy-5-deazaflavin:NADPH oxidoreductase